MFWHRFERPDTQTPAFNPELDFMTWLHPQSCAEVFRDGDLSFTADGRDLDSHENDYNKSGGLQRV
jgi:hypothetical protein